MSKAKVAADAIKRAAKQYEGFILAAEALEEIGSLENALDEVKASHALATSEFKKESNKLKSMKGKVTAAEEQALQNVEESNTAASEAITSAEEECELMILNAKKEADLIITTAQQTALHELDSLKSEVKKLTAKKSTLTKSIAKLEKSALESAKKVEEGEIKLQSIKGSIAKLSGGL